MKNVFSFHIDSVSNQTISLKNLLKTKLYGAFAFNNLHIKITLADNISVHIIDDLLDFDIAKSTVEIFLNYASFCNYELKLLNFANLDMKKSVNGLNIKSDNLIEKNLYFRLIGSLAQAKVDCICKGLQNQIFNFKTIQDHQASDTKSDLLIKGAFCQASAIYADSLVSVSKELQNVHASQNSKNLLLGCDSNAICLPKLEVESDKAECLHAASVCRIDDDMLFYLQSRGFSFCGAKDLLVESFLNS